MNLTMIAIGSAGDVRPYVILGKELTARGHRVTIASFSSFEGMAERGGLAFFPLSGDAAKYLDGVMQPGTNLLNYFHRAKKTIREIAPLLIRDMSESCSSADALICTFFGSLNYSVAEKYDIPCVQTHYYPMIPTGRMPIAAIRRQTMPPWMNLLSYRVSYLLVSLLENQLLSGWRKKNGLTHRRLWTDPNRWFGNHPMPAVCVFSRHLVPVPPDWPEQVCMSGFWFEDAPEAWDAPESLVRFLENGEPPVYIGFGSMTGEKTRLILPAAEKAVRAVGCRAVIAGETGVPGITPDGKIYRASFVPHDWLFSRVRAVVHHGGAGTTSCGLRYGKPTLVIPFAGDQPFWGSRVYSTGCGPKPIPCEKATEDRLVGALADLLSQPGYRERAAAMGAALGRETGVRSAADYIEQVIADRRKGAGTAES